MSGRFAARNKVAIVGYAQSQVERHARSVAGRAGRRDRPRRNRRRRSARRADRRLRHRELSSRPPAPTPIEDGVSIVSSRTGSPSTSAPIRAMPPASRASARSPARSAMAVNAIASGAADYVLLHRALHNPPGNYHGNPMTAGARTDAMDRAAGVFRAAGDDRPALQRVPAALRRHAARRWRRWWSRRARTARASRGRTGTTGR